MFFGLHMLGILFYLFEEDIVLQPQGEPKLIEFRQGTIKLLS